MIVTAVGARQGSTSGVQVFGIPSDSKFSKDCTGTNFKDSRLAPIAGQDVKFHDDRVIMAGPSGPCVSHDGGAIYR